jgi:hypothetical protein
MIHPGKEKELIQFRIGTLNDTLNDMHLKPQVLETTNGKIHGNNDNNIDNLQSAQIQSHYKHVSVSNAHICHHKFDMEIRKAIETHSLHNLTYYHHPKLQAYQLLSSLNKSTNDTTDINSVANQAIFLANHLYETSYINKTHPRKSTFLKMLAPGMPMYGVFSETAFFGWMMCKYIE